MPIHLYWPRNRASKTEIFYLPSPPPPRPLPGTQLLVATVTARATLNSTGTPRHFFGQFSKEAMCRNYRMFNFTEQIQ